MTKEYQLSWDLQPKPIVLKDYPSTTYFCVHPLLSYCKIAFTKFGTGALNFSLKYSFDQETWYNYTLGEELTLVEHVYFKGNNSEICNNYAGIHFSSSLPCYISGKLKSLLNEDLTATVTAVHVNPVNSVTSGLFLGNHNIYKADGLILDMYLSNSITAGCYARMFKNCSSLQAGPSIALADMRTNGDSFAEMYANCESLTAAPSINVHYNDTCARMFFGCKKLIDISNLSITQTAVPYEGLYELFMNCSSLAKPLSISSVTSVGQRGLVGMFKGCSNLGVYSASSAEHDTQWVLNFTTDHRRNVEAMLEGTKGDITALIPSSGTDTYNYTYYI